MGSNDASASIILYCCGKLRLGLRMGSLEVMHYIHIKTCPEMGAKTDDEHILINTTHLRHRKTAKGQGCAPVHADDQKDGTAETTTEVPLNRSKCCKEEDDVVIRNRFEQCRWRAVIMTKHAALSSLQYPGEPSTGLRIAGTVP